MRAGQNWKIGKHFVWVSVPYISLLSEPWNRLGFLQPPHSVSERNLSLMLRKNPNLMAIAIHAPLVHNNNNIINIYISHSLSLSNSRCLVACSSDELYLFFFFYLVPSFALSLSFSTLRGYEDDSGVWARWICCRQTSSPVARQLYWFFRFCCSHPWRCCFSSPTPSLCQIWASLI